MSLIPIYMLYPLKSKIINNGTTTGDGFGHIHLTSVRECYRLIKVIGICIRPT